MRKAVTVQANTVDEAIQQALDLIDLPMDQVHIEVVSNPGRRLMGLRKVLAEVTVTEVDSSASEKPNTIEDRNKIEELASALDEGIEEPPSKVQSAEVAENEEDSSAAYGAKIIEGQLSFQFDGDQLPVLIPHSNVLLYVNDELQAEPTTISPADEVHVTLCDELIPPHFSIQLIEQEMIALLTFTPGKRITRSLPDSEFSPRLHIRAQEAVEVFNNLDPQQIVDELKAMGIQQGLQFPAIKKVTEVEKPYELIVAKGTLPVEGSDGDLEVHIHYEEFDPNSEEKVNFREMNAIANVKEGQVIATHVPPVPGTPGRNLLGKVIPVKPVRDIALRLGKHVKQVDHSIIALISGKPSLEWRDRLVKVDVHHEFNHPGEVDLESGNIRFEGDVRIGGNVLPSMFVGATGSIAIGGSVTKATVHAVKSAVIRGNVFSSSVSVGKQEIIISEHVDQLKTVVQPLEQIKGALDQIFLIRGQKEEDLTPSELKRLIYLLMEKKYAYFEELNKKFIQSVRDNEEHLTEEWKDVADRLYDLFVNPLKESLQGLNDFVNLINDAEVLVKLFDTQASPKESLVLPYAINSTLYSNGNIHVSPKGVYHSTLTAGNEIHVKGVCRGGELQAQQDIFLKETGSESPVKTVVKTSAAGKIKIGKAYAGTEIQVGPRKHVFTKDATNITARLDSEGNLILG